MDADEVTSQVVLPAERPPAFTVRANMWLEAVGLVGEHVLAQIPASIKGYTRQSRLVGSGGRCGEETNRGSRRYT